MQLAARLAPSKVAEQAFCLHCGQPVLDRDEKFCCHGCASVYELLHTEGLERYYDLGSGAPQASGSGPRDLKWLEALVGKPGWILLDVQGVHCSACVWLFEQLFMRRPGALAIEVNPALGSVRLASDAAFDLRDFVETIERFGYRLGPARKEREAGRDPLVLRMGISIALAMNAMTFAVAFYTGLADGPLFRFFHTIELGLGTLSVLVGGSYFVRLAWQGLRQRVLHLDLPIALGIVLAYGSSLLSYAVHRNGTYFDTLTVFIALMLVGRWLQERVLAKNRRELLANDGIEGLLTRTVEAGAVELVPCVQVRTGTRLLIAPGDLVPVDAVLEDAHASCSLDWISGESAPRDFARGDGLIAGSFNAGDQAFVATASQDFQDSAVVDLVRGGGFSRTPWRRWETFARRYVLAVLAAASLGFVFWGLWLGDVPRALEVTAGVLIVTCPCAFGIATPLGYELVQAALRKLGLFVQSRELLDRAREVRRIVFDKTGTLTTGRLEVADPAALAALGQHERDVLYTLTSRSAHPKSAAISRALGGHASFHEGLESSERAGHGLRAVHQGITYRLENDGQELAFFVGNEVRLRIAFLEHLRPDATRELEQLREDGYELWIASGDQQERVDVIAAQCAIAPSHALGAQRPQDKARLVEELGRALMIGDGINDGLAAERAFCSGTPSIDRPFLPARTDFYFTTPGLGPITHALRAARALGRVQRHNLWIAISYNILGVSLAWAGLLSPLACAVLMPISSLTVVMATVWSLGPRRTPWKS